jgi:predicted enzyme related to lactoylglutathione lyase
MEFSICIDVDNVDRAVEFYGRGLGLTVVEQHPDGTGEARCSNLLDHEGAGGRAGANLARLSAALDPVHLDFAVDDIEEAVKRAVDAGGQLEGEIQRGAKGALANLAVPHATEWIWSAARTNSVLYGDALG